jgi:hypothetical protein
MLKYRGPPIPPSNKRDRFDLPIVPPSLLSESPEERCTRIALIERLAIDLFKTAETHLGRSEAKRLFSDVAKKAPEGKKPDHQRNAKLLELYDREIQTGTTPKAAPRRVAETLPKPHAAIESIARQIRELVKSRDRRTRAMAEAYRRVPSTLLGKDL